MLETNPRLLILLSLISGLAGGALAALFLAGSSVTAQLAPADVPKTISAQEFRLVDTQGRVRAMLAFTALPLEAAGKAHVVFHVALAGLGMYAFTRLLGASIFGGLLSLMLVVIVFPH